MDSMIIIINKPYKKLQKKNFIFKNDLGNQMK